MMIQMARGKVVREKKTLRAKKKTCAVKHIFQALFMFVQIHSILVLLLNMQF
jgi:hypothetical protein